MTTFQDQRTDATQTVYIISIDIKDGVYDIIHGFSNREAAETYMAWQQEHSGDHCYVTEVQIVDGWAPDDAKPLVRNRFLSDHEAWMEADSHRHVHWDDDANDWRRCEARHQ